MNIKEYCKLSQNEDYYVQVHYKDMNFDEPAIESDHIVAIEDTVGNLIGYLIGNDYLAEFFHKEDVRWFRILKVEIDI